MKTLHRLRHAWKSLWSTTPMTNAVVLLVVSGSVLPMTSVAAVSVAVQRVEDFALAVARGSWAR